MQLEGVRVGSYARVEVRGIPYEFVKVCALTVGV